MVGRSRWVNRSMPWTQKLPPRPGVEAPTVAIGRPRTRLEFEYAAQYDMYLSSAMSPAIMKPTIAVVRMTGARSGAPMNQPIAPLTTMVSAASTRKNHIVIPLRM